MIQLVEPKLTTKSKAGYCLWFQEEDFGTPHLYDDAADNNPNVPDAWTAAQFKHPDEQPPSDVCVPVYWTYTEGGVGYGHIADSVPGKGVFSSPLDSAFGNEWFPSIQAMTDRIKKIDPNSRYLGWSEDLANVRIVKEGDMDKITKEQEDTCALMQTYSLPGKDYNYQFTGRDLTQDNLDQMLQFWSGMARPAQPTTPVADPDGQSYRELKKAVKELLA